MNIPYKTQKIIIIVENLAKSNQVPTHTTREKLKPTCI